MSRDHRKLFVFTLADDLAVDVYRLTHMFPREERYGLTAQLRKASQSAPTNIVEGCARRTEAEYLYFVNIAMGSACEAHYLLRLAWRLGIIDDDTFDNFDRRYGELERRTNALMQWIETKVPKRGRGAYRRHNVDDAHPDDRN
jgi:four helix bundle protein